MKRGKNMNENIQKVRPRYVAETLRKRLRRSLTNVGMSPLMRVEEVDLSHVSFLTPKKEVDFIRKMKRFLMELDPLEREFFDKEFLCLGVEYRFWWRFYFNSDSEYSSEMRFLAYRAYKTLGGYFDA